MISSVLLSLALVTPAEATNGRKIKNIRVREITNDTTNSTDRATPTVSVTTDSAVAAVVAEVESDAGSEELALVESDAWLHGSAAFDAAPSDTATYVFTAYDATNAALGTFTVDAEGGVTDGDPADGLELRRLGVPARPTTGYDAVVDLGGEVAWDVAYGELTAIESETTEVCTAYDKAGVCLKSGTVTTILSKTTVEVGWEELQSVWEAEADLEHQGEIVVKAKSYDARGKKTEAAKAKLARAWTDGGGGQGSLALDEDPFTTLALISDQYHAGGTVGFVVHSTGWTETDALPEVAEVELGGGETWTVPVNSVQVTGSTPITMRQMSAAAKIVIIVKGDDTDEVANVAGAFAIDGDTVLDLDDVARPICAEGVCVAVTEGLDGGWDVMATAYADGVDELGVGVDLSMAIYDAKGNKLDSEDLSVTYTDEVAVVFGNEATFVGDPFGLDLTGTVKLQGAANKKGNRDTLAKGKFVATVITDEDGDLALAGQDKDVAVARGDILIGGEPIGFELTVDDNGDGYVSGPPAIQCQGGYGNGYNPPSAQGQTQQTQLL